MPTTSPYCTNHHLQDISLAPQKAAQGTTQLAPMPQTNSPDAGHPIDDTYPHLRGIGLALLIAVMCVVPFLNGVTGRSSAPLLAENTTDTQTENEASKAAPSHAPAEPSLMNPNSYLDRAKDAASKVESRQDKVDDTYSATN